MPKLLDVERLRALFAYDPETGEITLTNGRKGTHTNPGGYVCVRTTVGGVMQRYSAHRLAWALMTGHWPEGDIDHINGQRDDNRWCNLRCTDRASNLQNRIWALKGTKSGLLGVSFLKDRKKHPWSASITVHLGTFATREEAHAAYLEAKRKLHKGYVEGREVQQ